MKGTHGCGSFCQPVQATHHVVELAQFALRQSGQVQRPRGLAVLDDFGYILQQGLQVSDADSVELCRL